MNQKLRLVETINELRRLDQCNDYLQLAERLRQLPAKVPLEHQAVVSFLRGKLAVLEGDFPKAIPDLALSAQLAPQKAGVQSLLGAVMVRCEHWLDARQALRSALDINPTLVVARQELATVQLALNDPAGALRLLVSLPDSPSGPLRGHRACAAVRSSGFVTAAQAAGEALSQDSRLPESLLLEWLQLSGGLLMAGRFQDGRAWLQVLVGITPAAKAIANPVPRRVALIALVLLELIDPSNAPLEALLRDLDLQCWLLPSASEHELWDDWLENWILLVATRLKQQNSRELNRAKRPLKAVIAALDIIKPPRRSHEQLFDH